MKNNIKMARENKGLTQQECADIFGVKIRAWQTYEQGVSEPKYELLCKIADLFNVSTDYLLGREEQTDPLALLNVSVGEKEAMAKYALLPEGTRQLIVDTMIQLAEAAKAKENQSEKRMSARTGDLIYDEQAEETDVI